MARVNALEAAQQLALKGDIDGARKSLQSLADAGDGAACAALAEIAAFTGDWPAVLRHVALALSRPGDLYSLNVYEDLAMLAARAGKELGAWESLGDIARAAKEVLPVEGDESTEAWIGIAENLARASKRKSAKALLTPPVLAAETRKAKFDSGLQGLDDPKMKKRYPSPTARGNYLYALARGLDFPQGAIQQWDRSALPLPTTRQRSFWLRPLRARVAPMRLGGSSRAVCPTGGRCPCPRLRPLACSRIRVWRR